MPELTRLLLVVICLEGGQTQYPVCGQFVCMWGGTLEGQGSRASVPVPEE